jgi:hypothetical protein
MLPYLLVAFCVYRGQRWPLFFYVAVVIWGCVDLVLIEPMLWAKAFPVLTSSSNPVGLAFALLRPIVQFAAAVYCAIVVYLKIWRARPPNGLGPAMPLEGQRS